MASDSQMSNLALRDCKLVFEGLESIVDVGGGTGTTAKIICEAFPNLKCIVFDRPQVVENLSGSLNLTYVGGDMFKSIPKVDAVLLKVLYVAPLSLFACATFVGALFEVKEQTRVWLQQKGRGVGFLCGVRWGREDFSATQRDVDV
ncbi:hypothetical protein JHK87_022260 [Glycine soja]|nr:hypothetical protein JHK87_022260 [Glycine soja]